MFTQVGLLARALLANILVVPLIGVIVARSLGLQPLVATGILLMAISPGVPFVLINVKKKGGSLSLAVALAFLLPLVSLVTVPITAEWVLPVQATAELPLANFVKTLALFQLLPLLAGIAVAAAVGGRVARMERVLNVIFLVALVALLVALAPRVGHAVSVIFGSRGIIAVIFIVVLSAATGWLMGGPEVDERRVLTLATLLRNIGLASSIATTSFREPEIVAAVVVYFLVQVITSLVLGVLYTRAAKRAVA
jgi:BASS family bile acid:Na+ symporter